MGRVHSPSQTGATAVTTARWGRLVLWRLHIVKAACRIIGILFSARRLIAAPLPHDQGRRSRHGRRHQRFRSGASSTARAANDASRSKVARATRYRMAAHMGQDSLCCFRRYEV